MRILVYYQSSNKTVFIASLLQGFVERGHTVYLLTTSDEGPLHTSVEAFGVVASSSKSASPKFQYLKSLKTLIKFCYRHKIDVIYSHLQNANLVALAAMPFIRAKVFPCRHHIDEVKTTGNKNGILIDRLVNVLAKKIVVVSKATKDYMHTNENVNPDKIVVINLGYKFDLYEKPDQQRVNLIKDRMPCKLLMIIISRMIPEKGHLKALKALNALLIQKLDVKMIILDQGPEKSKLIKYTEENNLSAYVLFTGYLCNISDYIEAADLLICPSTAEASNQVVKEAGFLGKPSIVISGVGDFDEYIYDNQNGFLVTKERTQDDLIKVLSDIYWGKYDLKQIGKNQKQVVEKRFAIKPIVDKYLALCS